MYCATLTAYAEFNTPIGGRILVLPPAILHPPSYQPAAPPNTPLQSGRYSGDLTVGLIAYGATGAVQNGSTARSPLSLTQEQFNQAAKNGIEIVRTVALDDATRNIRVAVFDRASNQTGSVTVPNPGH